MVGMLFLMFLGSAQEFKSFEIRYQENLKGELTFIANNILNRSTNQDAPESPYNLTGNSSQYNDYLNMQYIDVDADASTFSSSSATFSYQDNSCNLVRYAGLYWSATYPSENSNQAVGTNRQSDFNQVKLKIPGGNYVDIVADEILYDGYTSSDNSMRTNSPYACYADVTSLVAGLSDPKGEYTVANVRAVNGYIGGGASAGWTLVVVYENPTLTGKRITTFDGFARVRSNNPEVDIDYNGFNTIPVGPVRANIGVAALEGDNRITGDQLRIRAASNGGFTTLSDPVNASNNFFNSNITLGGSLVTSRNPNSVNTLGYDTDIFLLNNPLNNVLPNSETAATFRFTSNGDQYYPFFNSFNVEVIEPDIILKKRVEDIAGNDITGAGVNLGQVLDYVLSFQNQGNDDATNYVIRDVLPVNVTLDEANLNLPAGVTYTYDPLSRELTLQIPDNLVEVGDPFYDIRIRVQVSENCFDFVDACSDTIQNLAYSTYQGVINDNQITDDPSVSDFDTCGFVTPGSTNFLLDDLSDCGFFRSLELCGTDLILDAGDNFDDYVWYRDNNANGEIDGGDTVITDGDPDNDPSTLRVTQAGQYIVDKMVSDPCKGFQEVIEVTLPGVTQFNPIVSLINDPSSGVEGEISICPNDGQPLPKIFLCGINDAELIQINLPDAQSIVWERLDEGSCIGAGEDCANKNSACTWSQVDSGNDFLAAESGEYRVVVNYQNGCFTRFYFNVFKNLLDPQYAASDIICETPGNITVTNVPSGYEFQLMDANTGAVLVPYAAGNGPSFDIAQSGAYTVEIRQEGVIGGCLFYLEDIGVRARDFQVQIEASDVDCNGLGNINISALDVEPQYYFELMRGGVVIDTHGPGSDNQYAFENLTAGTYQVAVSTDDGCAFNQEIIVADVSDLDATAVTIKPIDCTDGIISVQGSGGFPNPDYLYAIWSYNGTDLYPDISSIPADNFQTNGLFSFTPGEEGEYQFIVVDANNCYVLTNVTPIALAVEPDYTLTTTEESCFGEANGSLQVNLNSNNGYTLSYTLLLPDGSQQTNASGSFPNLGQGDYQLTITRTLGGNSCGTSVNVVIGGPSAALTTEATLTQAYTCLQEASIQALQVQGGTGPYEYAIDGVTFQSSDTFTGLTAGSYTITVRDANGCAVDTAPIVVAPLQFPNALVFSETPVTCPDQTSDVTVAALGGTAPYTYQIVAPGITTPGSATDTEAVFTALSPGTYTFRVTDVNGCTFEETHTIYPITPISVVGQATNQISCFGSADGSLSFGISDFASTYNYTITGPQNFTGQDSSLSQITLNNLSAGTYVISVTDGLTGCSATDQVTIESPAEALTLSATGIQPTCIEEGGILLNALGGWGGNTFTLTFPDGVTTISNTSGNFQGLTQAGTYLAAVQDANGCEANASFTLISPEPPVVEVATNNDCYNANDGLTIVAYLTAGIGDGNFRYRINGGNYTTINVFTGLGPGTYTVEVIDRNNCSDSTTITVNPQLTVMATASVMASCLADSEVIFTAAGGGGNYVYAIMPEGASPTDADFASLDVATVSQAGNYVVYARDNNGDAGYCQAEYALTVAQDDPLTLTAQITDILCNGNSSGAIEATPTGGRAPYRYSIDNGLTNQSSNVFLNLSSGTYTILVQDSEGCEFAATYTVAQADPIVAEAQVTRDYTCLEDGEITVGSVFATSGGSGNYQYRLNGGAWSSPTSGGISFGGLTSGTYTVNVRDAAAPECMITLPVLEINPLPVAPNLSASIDYTCDGNGVATVMPFNPNYTYSLNGGTAQSSNLFEGLNPGSHVITVNYGSGCTVDLAIVVNPGNALQAQIVEEMDALCAGASNGAVRFEVLNANLSNGFIYQINGGGFSAPQFTSEITLTGLVAGNYTIQVRDALESGCEVGLTALVNEPQPVSVLVSLTGELTCSNSGATISASASGGTPSYQYQLESETGVVLVPFQTGNVFASLAEGQYLVRAQDINGCESTLSSPVEVVAPQEILFTATPTVCYSGNNDGEIAVSVSQGNGGYSFSINGGPWLLPAPVNLTAFLFQNLTAGIYEINVRDQYGCSGTPIEVTINPEVLATATLSSGLTCNDAALITITASGGTGVYAYEWSDDNGATWNNSNFLGNVFEAATPGTYRFRVTDASSGCLADTTGIVVATPTQPVIAAISASQIFCYGDESGVLQITIDNTTGFPPYAISVVETTTGVLYGNQVTGLPAGDYSVTITDANGCVSEPYAISILQPDAINHSVSVEPISCDATGITPGSITVQGVTGGSGSYTYYLTGNNGYTEQYIAASGADYTFGPLPFGIYELDVVDSNGCSVRTRNIISSPPDDLDIDVSTLTADCASGGTAVVTVSSLVGSGDYEFAILETYAAPYAATYQSADVSGGYTATFTGLVPGVTYTFVVHDRTNDCYYFESAAAPVNSPSAMTVNSLVTSDVTCTGAADGTVSLEIAGYDLAASGISWELFSFQSNTAISPALSGAVTTDASGAPLSLNNLGPLAPGVYYVLLAEVGGAFNGCSVATVDFSITQSTNPLQLTATATVNDNCSLNAGEISAVAQFGTAPYLFQFRDASAPAPLAADSGWTSVSVANVEAGDYMAYVLDARGCIQAAPVTVSLDPQPQIALQVVDACAEEGAFEVRADLTQTGVGPYQISVNGGPYQNTNLHVSGSYILSGLSSGLGQTISVRDINGCSTEQIIDIYPPLQFTATLTGLLDCEVGSDGNAEISIQVNQGSNSYDFEVAGPVNQDRMALPSNSYTWHLASLPGTYAVTVYDTSTPTPNCLGTIDVVVPEVVLPEFSISSTAVSCAGSEDGSIRVFAVDNGIGALSYSISPAAGTFDVASSTFINLPPGDYTITATAANACTTQIGGIIIGEPAEILVPTPAVTPFACVSGNTSGNASIVINASGITGGTGNYVTFEFVNTQGTASTADDILIQSGSNPVFVTTDTSGGAYVINVYDSYGCMGSTSAEIPAYDALLDLTAMVSNPLSCNPGNDAEITLTAATVSGNLSLLEYSINNGATWQDTPVFSGLDAGSYTLLARHKETNCMLAVVETIQTPEPFTVLASVVQDQICYGSDSGAVVLELQDATYLGGFDWAIYNTNGTVSDLSDDVLALSGSQANNGPTAPIAVASGNYRVTVSQVQLPGCVQEAFFNVSGPDAPISGEVAINPITCLGNDGAIEIFNMQGGSGNYTYFIGVGAPLNAADYSSSPLQQNLPAGTYQAWALDTFGCETLIAENLILEDPAPITGVLQINNENCTEFEGELEVIGVAGGAGQGYLYQLIRNGVLMGAAQPQPIFSGLGAGTYQVQITDAMDCEVTLGPVILYAEMYLVATVDSSLRCDNPAGGVISLQIQGGSSNLQFEATYPDGTTTATNNTGVFEGLSQPGTYVFSVLDLETNPSCSEYISVNLNEPDTVLLDLPAIENVSCYGNSDGGIRVNLADATAGINNDSPFNYSLFNGGVLMSGPQSSPIFNSLPAGTYTVEVRSAQGCVATQEAVIEQPEELTVALTATPFACDSGNSSTGAIVTALVPNGTGTAPYLYSLDGISYHPSNQFDIADTGVSQLITVFVKDQQGCTVSASITLAPLNRFVPSVIAVTDLNCAAPGELLVSVSDNGNVSNTYSFELLPIGNPNGHLASYPSNTEALFEVSNPGNYVFRVTDTTTGCYQLTAPFEVAPFDLISALAIPNTGVVCYGDDSGSISLVISEYSGSFTYDVFESGGNSTGVSGTATTGSPLVISGLEGGNYYVEVTALDAPFCGTTSNTFTINSPNSPLSATVAQVAPVTCSDSEGEIQVLPTGGYAPYSIVLENLGTGALLQAEGVNDQVFIQLSSGNYRVQVTDAAGCVYEESIQLDQTTSINALAEATPAVLACFGDTNGVVTAVQVSGGSGSYQYQLHTYDASGTVIISNTGYQSNPEFRGLGAGIYSITVSDGWSCDIETNLVSIIEPSDVLGELAQSAQLSCTEAGQLVLTASGGTAPYQYSTDGIQFYPMSDGTSHTFTVLPGTYQYYVRDVFGCGAQLTNQVVIEPVDPLQVTLNTDTAVVNCAGEATAAIYALASGGLGDYRYTLFADAALSVALTGPQTHGNFENLSSGSYWIQVTSADCEARSEAVIISEPQPLVVVREEANPVSCSGESDGSIVVEVSGGTGEIRYAITPNLNQFDTVNTFTGLAPGTYQVIAQDQSGCFLLFDFDVAEPEPIQILGITTSEVCTDSGDGMIEIEITGGQAPYWTALDSNQPNSFIQGQLLFTDLSAGTHVIFVRDSRGCEATEILTIDAGVNINASVTPVYSCTGDVPDNYLEVVLEDAGMADSVMYALDTTDPSAMQLTADFANLTPGQHYLAISHLNGCLTTIPFEIADFQGLTLTLAEGNINQLVATAQGGSPQYRYWLNDVDMGTTNSYYISESGIYTVRVMDENGCVVEAQIFMQYIEIELPDHFSPTGEVLNELWMPKNVEAYPNILIKIYDRYGRVVADLSGAVEGWDGTYNGKPLPTGDYWYVVRLNGQLDDREFFGHFTLYR